MTPDFFKHYFNQAELLVSNRLYTQIDVGQLAEILKIKDEEGLSGLDLIEERGFYAPLSSRTEFGIPEIIN